MGLYEKIKRYSKNIVGKAKSYSADELIADSIIKAAKKKEKVNVILEEKGSLYRISRLELDIDFPPSVFFKISELSQESSQSDSNKKEKIQVDKENAALANGKV